MKIEPIKGYVCLKCRGTQGALLPSGAVVCPRCPWEPMVACGDGRDEMAEVYSEFVDKALDAERAKFERYEKLRPSNYIRHTFVRHSFGFYNPLCGGMYVDDDTEQLWELWCEVHGLVYRSPVATEAKP